MSYLEEMKSAESEAVEIVRRVEDLRCSNRLLIEEKIEILRKLISIIEKYTQPEIQQ